MSDGWTNQWKNMNIIEDDNYEPDTILVFECKCGEVFNPNTKSFQRLANEAKACGWNIKFHLNKSGYDTVCQGCLKNDIKSV